MVKESQMGKDAESKSSTVDVAGVAVWSIALVGPMAYREVLGGQTAPYWCGTQGGAWAIVGGSAAGAAVFVFVAGLAARWAIARLTGRGCPAPLTALFGFTVLWAVLMFLVADTPVLLEMPALVSPVVLAAAGIVLRLLFGMPYRVSGFVALAALASGAGVHETAARFFLLKDNRADVAFAVSLAWMVFIGIAGLLIMAFPKKGHRWYRGGVVVVLSIGLPFGFALFPVLYPAKKGNADNVLLITIDALRADYCSVYGSANSTPNIDAVAERGVVFERAYVTAPWTLPSLYSVCASEYSPLWLPGQDFQEWVNRVRTAFFEPEEPAIAERYKKKGYHTAFITGNTLLDDRNRLLRGFDEVYILPFQIGETHNPCAGMPLLGPAVERIRPETARTWPFDSTRRITAYARAFLRHNTGRPYFLWIHYMDPHDPYNPPYAYRDIPTEYAFYPAKPRICAWDPARKEPDWSTPEDKIVIGPERLYAAEVRYVDDMLGEFIGLAGPSTWVIIGADHGEEFWEHGRMSHRNAFYEESVHVPLIIAGPACVPRRIPPPVSYVDLIPTLAGLTGLEPSADWQGKNLAALISGKDIPGWERPCFAGCNDATVAPPSVMVVDGDMKLILNLVDGSVEVYDLSEDPKERNNLAETGMPPEAKPLKRKAEAWVKEVTERHRTRKPPPMDAEQSEELRQQFEALGYL